MSEEFACHMFYHHPFKKKKPMNDLDTYFSGT